MLLISQNARLSHIPIPETAVLRLNAAWVKSLGELDALLDGIRNDVFMDFPQGRTKPPRPVLHLAELLDAMRRHPCIRYFALSNVRSAEAVESMRPRVPPGVQLVPKIESLAGVENLGSILAALPYPKRHIMLDKEDLYTDLRNDNDKLEASVHRIRELCGREGVQVLELAGVIFISADG